MTIALNALTTHYRFRTTDTLGDKVKAVCWRHQLENRFKGDPFKCNSWPKLGKTYLRQEEHSSLKDVSEAIDLIDKREVLDPKTLALQKSIGAWLLGDNRSLDFEDNKRLSTLDRPTAIGYFLAGVFSPSGKTDEFASILEAVFSSDRGYRRSSWRGDETNQRDKLIIGMSLYLFDHSNPENTSHDKIIEKIVKVLGSKLGLSTSASSSFLERVTNLAHGRTLDPTLPPGRSMGTMAAAFQRAEKSKK